MEKIKLAIVDDQKLFLEGLRYIVKTFNDIEVILEASNGRELIELIPSKMPDVILMDLKMPQMDGLEATKYIKANFPNIKIILLTLYDDERFINLLMDHGANSYLVKNEDPEVLQEAILSVVSKGYFFNDYISKALLNARKNKIKRIGTNIPLNDNIQLSQRELEILELICQEFTTSEIAKKLFITARTVDGHRRRLLDKTGAKNVVGLVIFAYNNNLFKTTKDINQL